MDARMEKVVDILVGDDLVAKVLVGASILVERGWTQGAMARTGAGMAASPSRSDAVCWCASGAIWAAAERLLGPQHAPLVEREARERLRDVISPAAPTIWNDAKGRTAAEVAAKLREAAGVQAEAA